MAAAAPPAANAPADACKAAADRAAQSIDDALAFIEASNHRIAAIEASALAAREEAA